MTTHIMLDIETLGTKPGCPILSIGAAVFSGIPEFKLAYFSITVQEEQSLMHAPDPDTVKWWSTQPDEARVAVFNNPNAVPITEVLKRFNSYLMQFKTEPEDRVILWGNGATFDVPIIEEAYKRYGITPVWTFRDSMCFRTLKELGKLAGVEEPEFTGVRHNSLCDAVHQAKWALLITSKIGLQL